MTRPIQVRAADKGDADAIGHAHATAWVDGRPALEPIEKAPRAELQRLQLERLQSSLKHAYENVPRYRKKFDAAGVRGCPLRS